MKPKFSLRDLFWLVLVVALGLGWWLDRWSQESDHHVWVRHYLSQQREMVDRMHKESQEAHRRLLKKLEERGYEKVAIQKAIRDAGFIVRQSDDGSFRLVPQE